MRHMKKKSFVFIMLVFVLVLAGCGAGTASKDGSSSNGTPNSDQGAAQGGDKTEATPETRTIKHALGETEIKGVPKRIVALEWLYAEDVLALGIQPVGVADIEGMNQWVNIPVEIGPEVTDVGTRQEPNVELYRILEAGSDHRFEVKY